MPKRKREAEDSDDLVELSKKVKDQQPENEEVISKLKKKKNKQKSADTTDESLVLDALSADEEILLHSPKKKKKKNKQQSADDSDEEDTQTKDVSSENEESLSLSPKKKKKKNKRHSEKEADSPSRESDKPQETSVTKPSKQKKASLSKGFVLFVGQIPHHVKQKDIEKHFATVGGVKDVRLLIYEDSQRSRGCAYVEFVDNQHRKAALKLNGSILGRAKIKVEYPYQGGKRYGGAKKNKSNEKNWKGSKNE